MNIASDSTSKILGQLDPKDFLSTYPHASAVCHNLQHSAFQNNIDSIEFFSEFSKQLPYNISYPLPMYSVNIIDRPIVNGLDPGLTLVKKKKVWDNYKKQILKYCTHAQAEKIEPKVEYKKSLSIPLNVVLLANHISLDPDKYFNSEYNCYYSGGNITNFQTNSEERIVWSRADNSGQIFIDKLVQMRNNSVFESDTRLILETNIKKPVYQIESSKNLLLTRQKENICLFSANENENELRIEKEHGINSCVPFFSIALNSKSFCSVSATRELAVVDIDTRKVLIKGEVDSEEGAPMGSDNWCSAHYINDNNLCFIDRTSISFIDLRIKPCTIGSRWSTSELTELCEEVFSAATGRDGKQYVVTNHQVLFLDPRAGFCQRWTHGITHSPVFISVLSDHLSDNIFIGSQRNCSVVFIKNVYNEEDSVSSSHPYTLPTTVETLHMARYNGICLSNIVSSRFQMSTTGLCVLDAINGPTVLRATSIGDVFSQSLTKPGEGKDIDLSEEDFHLLEEWEDKCEKAFQDQCKLCPVGNILSDQHLSNYLANSSDSKFEYTEPSQKVDISTASWRISKKDLLSCNDFLAQRLLQEWGIEDLEEWANDSLDENESEESSSDEEEDIAEKVARWIETYEEDVTDFNYTFHETPKQPLKSDKTLVEETLKSEPDNIEKLLPSSTPLLTQQSSQQMSLLKQELLQQTPPVKKKHISGF